MTDHASGSAGNNKAMASFLSILSSRSPGGGAEKTDEETKADEDQRTHSMMYVARMKYLDDSDQIKPNMLFMTRKQAQKATLRQDSTTAMVLKKLDVSASNRKAAAGGGTVVTATTAWKKAKASADERSQTWIKRFQAGCHFWQNEETGECRVKPPAGSKLVIPPGEASSMASLDDDEDENVPFPAAFAFLEQQALV
ncbi:TPA: hypothetical protein N0F65_011262 [Lagenidium giganteum]|uniref:Uncharacterized protein n=1 Tax=Lagenidium giganteum TaxID=4803 RepID=A0AAV2YVC4_9STRA|nr:TPA: hypothetical protein N0F65_011262 [Lagenidium giganteum]